MRDGEPVLTLQLSRERALANLAHATQQQGLVTFDSAISRGVIYLGYQKPDTRERGWFARLFGLKKPKPAPTSQYRLEQLDRKSTRLNSSHVAISYAVFCLKKKRK